MKLNLQDQEHIKAIHRQSILFMWEPMIVAVLAILVPWFILAYYDLAYDWRYLIYILALGTGAVYFHHFVIWLRTRYVITNKRVMVYYYHTLFKKTVSDTPLERIISVGYKTTGLISSLFRYGNVEIQIIGVAEPMVMKHVSNPAAVKDLVWDLHMRVVQDNPSFSINSSGSNDNLR